MLCPPMPTAELNATVSERIDLGEELAIFRIVPKNGVIPTFKPGQYVALGLPGTAPRCPSAEPERELPKNPEKIIPRAFSIASSPLTREYLEFYAVLVKFGSLTPRLWCLKPGDGIWLGPRITGNFVMDDVPADKNIVFVATGTGLAPYVSMVYTYFRPEQKRNFVIFHGVRVSQDLSYRAELMTLSRLCPKFGYIPIISRPQLDPIPWKGTTGHVQKLWQESVIEKNFGFKPTADNTHVFLCGSPQMIDDMVALLGKEGYKEHKPREPGQVHVERYW